MQCSIHHTRLVWTTQRIDDFLLRGRPRMLWSPSSFEVWGKRGIHETFHQFQQPMLHSKSADDAAHQEHQPLPTEQGMHVSAHPALQEPLPVHP